MPGFFRSLRLSAAALPSRARSRRGTVVLLALAFLAIVSIAALAYVTLVRVDRASSTALQRQQNYQQQVTAVVSDIQALLTADLFGNKVVTPSTPRIVLVNGFDVNVWPRFFEDGETWDYPYTNTRQFTAPLQTGLSTPPISRPTYTYAPAPGTAPTSPDWERARLGFFEETRPAPQQSNRRYLAALPDDAWLATYDPNWDPGDPNNTRSWQQITNLRSAYRFVQDTNGDGVVNTSDRPAWQRGDGLFADLSRFFTNPTPDGFANPAANLLVADTANPNGPNNLRAERGANQVRPDGADSVNYTAVMQFNMAQLGRQLGDSGNDEDVLDAVDEALWADTDGDLRPDARWTQLDSLGELYGLDWVVAVKIVDASALINVNSSIEFSYGPTTEEIATGATPADIDLFRLLNESNVGTAYSSTIRTDQLIARQFRAHIEQTLGVGQLIAELSADGSSIRRDPWVRSTYTPWQLGSSQLNPDQRDAFWRYIGAAPDRPAFSRAGSYPLRDMIDLFAFSGTNNRGLISKVEETFDGPETGGYLPGAGPGILTGPLRSKEANARARSFAPAPPTGERTPTLEQLQDSVRRYITPVSGVSLYSPVPTADGQTPMPKIGLRDLMNPPPGARPEEVNAYARRKPELVRRTFAGLVWALAPFATDGPLPAPLDEAMALTYGEREILASSPNSGYGAPSADGLGAAMIDARAPNPVVLGAAPAIIPALSLAANLADAIDSGGSAPPGRLPPYDDGLDPTVIRFYNDPLKTDDLRTPDIIELGTNLPQGTIFTNALSTTFFGAPSTVPGQTAKGVTVVGTEHTLMLTDVATIAIYDSTDETIEPGDAVCSVIMVRVANPWNVTLSTDPYYIRIPNSRETLDNNALVFQLVDPLTGPLFIPAGQSAVFFAMPKGAIPGDGPVFRDTTLDSLMRSQTFGMAPVREMGLVAEPPLPMLPSDSAIIFDHIDPTVGAPVLLCRRYGNNRLEVIVDRLSPPKTQVDAADDVTGFPAQLDTTSFLIDTPPAGFTYRNIIVGGQLDDDYWAGVGYTTVPVGSRDARINADDHAGRVALWSVLSRPGARPGAPLAVGGFPAYVMESNDGEKNLLTHAMDAVAWLVPEQLADLALTNYVAIKNNPTFLFDGAVGPIVQPAYGEKAELHLNPGTDSRAADANIPPNELASFQLHVPNAPLLSLSDVALISTAAFTYVNTRDSNDLGDLAVDALPTNFSIPLTNVTTRGEWMYLDREYDHSLSDGSISAPNPSIGTLDLTQTFLRRTITADPGTGEPAATFMDERAIPDSLSVPLSTRVFEIFEPHAPVERLLAEGVTKVQGRVNINTAPNRVLQMVPYMSPSLPITGLGGGAMLQPDPDGLFRLQAVLDYRDQAPSTVQPDRSPKPEEMTELDYGVFQFGLRQTSLNAIAELDQDLPAGFLGVGELAILGKWSQNAARLGQPDEAALDDYTRGFLAFGADSAEMGKQPFTSIDNQVAADNDAEERLGLFHGVANSVTTRSDVYIAWFIIRGYDPKTIEGISVTGNPLNAMKDDTFRPAYESRWLGVFDRSNVRQPTDRPKILLLVELPKSSG